MVTDMGAELKMLMVVWARTLAQRWTGMVGSIPKERLSALWFEDTVLRRSVARPLPQSKCLLLVALNESA